MGRANIFFLIFLLFFVSSCIEMPSAEQVEEDFLLENTDKVVILVISVEGDTESVYYYDYERCSF